MPFVCVYQTLGSIAITWFVPPMLLKLLKCILPSLFALYKHVCFPVLKENNELGVVVPSIIPCIGEQT